MVSLVKNSPKTMVEMLLKAQKYMNAKYALAVIKDEEKTSEKGRKEDDCRGRKRERQDRQTSDGGKRKDEKAPRTVKFTPLVMLVDKILVRLKMSTISNGLSHYIHHPTCLIRRSIAVSTRIMAII